MLLIHPIKRLRVRPLTVACLLALALPIAAWGTPILGAAQSFAVLGGATVTNTGLSTINGDIGVAPGTAITGMNTATQSGAIHNGDAAAMLAHADALIAADYLASLVFTRDLSGQDLGGMVLTAGVYRLASSAQLTGSLVLDAQNMANALFVFQIGSTLTMATASSVNVINGGAGTGVFFGVGTSAVLGAGSQFAGNIIAADSITFNAAASLLCGRALSVNGAVTLDTNALSNDCGSGDFGSAGFSGLARAEPGQDVPEPATLPLLVSGIMALAWQRARRPVQAR